MPTGRIEVAALVTVLAALTWGSHTVGAEESGSFRALRSYVRDYTAIEHGEGKITGGTLTGTSTVLQSSGGPFIEGVDEFAKCLVYAKTSQAGVDVDSHCTMTDSSGDSWFVAGKRRAGNIQKGGKGDFDLIGGTGKYAGVTGSCTYVTEYLPGVHIVSTADCVWQRP